MSPRVKSYGIYRELLWGDKCIYSLCMDTLIDEHTYRLSKIWANNKNSLHFVYEPEADTIHYKGYFCDFSIVKAYSCPPCPHIREVEEFSGRPFTGSWDDYAALAHMLPLDNDLVVGPNKNVCSGNYYGYVFGKGFSYKPGFVENRRRRGSSAVAAR